MFERLRRLVAENFHVDVAAITRDTPLMSLVRDSLELVDMVMVLEEILDVELPEEVAANLDVLSMTVGELAGTLEQHGKGTS